jgi:hypothetical protein
VQQACSFFESSSNAWVTIDKWVLRRRAQQDSRGLIAKGCKI